MGLAIALALVGCATGGTDSSVADTASGEDPNFIPAPDLTAERVNKLWDVAANKCYDFGYAVVNNDKTTRNLVCTTQSEGNTLTLRVRFTDTGIFVGFQSSSASWAMFGMKLGPKTREHVEMRKALRAVLGTTAQATAESQPRAAIAAPAPGQQASTTTSQQALQQRAPSSSEPMSIAELQRILSHAGYSPGPADGSMGKRTVDALKKFQQDRKLPATGKLDNSTVARLRDTK